MLDLAFLLPLDVPNKRHALIRRRDGRIHDEASSMTSEWPAVIEDQNRHPNRYKDIQHAEILIQRVHTR